jgi:hypothetical protein
VVGFAEDCQGEVAAGSAPRRETEVSEDCGLGFEGRHQNASKLKVQICNLMATD